METIAPNQDLTQVATKWQDTMLSLEKEYEQEPEVLKIGGVPIGTLGNFSASIGKAKSKKTFNVSAMVAAALSGKEVLNYTTDFPEGKNRILYIDTEQSQNHCMIVMHRIMKLAELPANEDCDRFYFLALRKFNPKERLAIIDDAISQIEGLGFVVIDGIRDLVYDINSPSEATCVISKLMQWTDEYQIHLHTILHQNKSDENASGHIGTEINNKAETIIQIDKDKDDSNISKVESVHTRSKDFQPFAFYINDQSLPELLPDYVPTKKSAGRPKQVENPLKVAPLIQSNLTPVKFFHSFILFILVFFVFFLSVMPGSTLNFVYKYNDSFLLLHLRSDSPKSSIRIA